MWRVNLRTIPTVKFKRFAIDFFMIFIDSTYFIASETCFIQCHAIGGNLEKRGSKD
jgi:hypothetical protein